MKSVYTTINVLSLQRSARSVIVRSLCILRSCLTFYIRLSRKGRCPVLLVIFNLLEIMSESLTNGRRADVLPSCDSLMSATDYYFYNRALLRSPGGKSQSRRDSSFIGAKTAVKILQLFVIRRARSGRREQICRASGRDRGVARRAYTPLRLVKQRPAVQFHPLRNISAGTEE